MSENTTQEARIAELESEITSLKRVVDGLNEPFLRLREIEDRVTRMQLIAASIANVQLTLQTAIIDLATGEIGEFRTSIAVMQKENREIRELLMREASEHQDSGGQ